jgi:uncharacterized protein YdaU (DUF1376 family)
LAGIFQQDLAGTLLVLTSPPTSERMSVSPKSFFLEKAMNYYPFHLGDYASHTGHLDPMEDLAYRRMLDAYYLREGQLPKDVTEIARLVRLRDDAATIRDVLNEFFEQTPEGWRHVRCDEEILKMRDKQAKARASAYASVNARKAKAQQPHSESTTNDERTLNERSTDVKLPTPTPTPTPTPVNKRQAVERPDGVSEGVWSDFLAIRKAKRSPLTQTALEAIQREADKVPMTIAEALMVCCARGWQGFKAEWVADLASKPKAALVSFAQQEREQGWKRWEEMTGREHPDRLAHEGKRPNQFIDIQATDILEIGK